MSQGVTSKRTIDNPRVVSREEWIAARKREYLSQFPQRAKNQGPDGYFYSMELNRFFEWVVETRRPR